MWYKQLLGEFTNLGIVTRNVLMKAIEVGPESSILVMNKYTPTTVDIRGVALFEDRTVIYCDDVPVGTLLVVEPRQVVV